MDASVDTPALAVAASPFDLNLRHLRGVLAVCDQGSISAAAVVLGLSQPALTQGIVKLEKSLGVPLFERRPHGVLPTEAGVLLRDRVRAAFAHLAAGSRPLAGVAFQPDRRLTMTQLRSFLALFDSGSFAQASNAIGQSDAATQRAIRSLERAVAKPLVERRGHGLALNPTGRRFARCCRLAFNEIHAAFSDLSIDVAKPTITIGTTPLARAYLVPEAMAIMGAERASTGFRVFEGSWGELVETLRDGLIDMIVGELPGYASPDIVKLPLYQESAVIVAGRQHPLVGVAQPSTAQLAAYPWIIGPENSPLRAEWARMFADGQPAAPIECGSIMVIGRLLTSSRMLTLATPDQVALQVRSGLLARVGAPLQERHTIGVTLRSTWRPSTAQTRFLHVVREVAAAMSGNRLRVPMFEPGWVGA